MSSTVCFDRLRVGGRRPSLPAGLRVYAVGDIHGRLDLLNKLLALVDADILLRPTKRHRYIFLGDYIDRGPASRQTVDRLIEHGAATESVFLKGNHESIAVRCLNDLGLFYYWLRLGGLETLLSYGVSPEILAGPGKIVELRAAFESALPPSHLHFFRSLQNSSQCGDFFFAHAGVRPNVALSRQKEDDLLWIREEFLSSSEDFGKVVVHGHTPTLDIDVSSNRVNIDTRAYATGRLTCLVIEGSCLSVIDTL
jgi:serine/threonine protein phosphatase 1